MFANLADAITLRVGFEQWGGAFATSFRDTEEYRKEWFCKEVQELRRNSGFTTDAEFRLITRDHVIAAVIHKVNAYQRSLKVGGGWLVHYTNGGKPSTIRTSYATKHGAQAACRKLNARDGLTSANPYKASPAHEYVASSRAKLVRNIMSGEWVMESTGTPYSCSVASESYWSN
jgi:hypothetical protein